MWSTGKQIHKNQRTKPFTGIYSLAGCVLLGPSGLRMYNVLNDFLGIRCSQIQNPKSTGVFWYLRRQYINSTWYQKKNAILSLWNKNFIEGNEFQQSSNEGVKKIPTVL